MVLDDRSGAQRTKVKSYSLYLSNWNLKVFKRACQKPGIYAEALDRKQLDSIPRLYETETTPLPDKIIYLHFFIGGCDWYIAEYDGEDLLFGYAILNGDINNGEWGYFSLKELQEIKVGFVEIDCDRHWTPIPARDVPLIRCW